MFNNRRWLIFILAVCSLSALGSDVDSTQASKAGRLIMPVDSTAIVHRQFSDEQIQKLKSNPDLNYQTPPTVAESLWDRFKRWLWEFIAELFRSATTSRMGWIVVYTLCGALLIYLIMTLLRVNAFRLLFSGGDVSKDSYGVLNENIHEMDFEKLISEAVISKDFRLGTRLVFLYALKTLADKHLVDWNPGKTNHDYLEEIKRADLKEGFTHLSLYFDYAWYGNFEVSPDIFQRMQSIFHNWRDRVNL